MHALPRIHAHSEAHRFPTWAWVAFGGVALGMADLAFAALYWFLHSGVAPIRIPQAIAGWVLGSAEARAGGAATAFAGAALYCAVIGAMVAGYIALSKRWPALHAQVALAGIAYGVAMYVLLFRIVLPLVAANASSSSKMPLTWTIACLAAYAGIGVGCALIARAKAACDD